MEIMIAMTIFSSMLLITTLTLTQISKMYYKGINSSKVQDTSRGVLANVTERVQLTNGVRTSSDTLVAVAFGSDPTTSVGDNGQVRSICIGDTRYTYVINRRLNPTVEHSNVDQQIRHVLWQDTKPSSDCAPVDLTAVEPSVGQELLGENMRLSAFRVEPISGTNAYTIEVGVVYGDNDLVERQIPADLTSRAIGCLGSSVGSQWCAASTLLTQSTRRVF